MFGLTIQEPHLGYIGWRAILSHGYVDIVPNRGSCHGDEASQTRLLAWVNKPMILPPLPKRKRPRKITPWKQMKDAASTMSGYDRTAWEVREGNFVLRCNPCASYGYLYIALFEEVPAAVICKFCQQQVPEATAHLHDGGWVGDACCWDERLRSTE